MENVATFRAIMAAGEATTERHFAVRDYVILNAAAALYCAGKGGNLKEAADIARQVRRLSLSLYAALLTPRRTALQTIKSGRAAAVLESYVRLSREAAEGGAGVGAPSILTKIVEQRRVTVAQEAAATPLESLFCQTLACPPRAPLNAVAR